MIIILKRNASSQALLAVVQRTKELGLYPNVVDGEQSVIVCSGQLKEQDRLKSLKRMPEVDQIIAQGHSFELSGKQAQVGQTKIRLSQYSVLGEKQFTIIAGPCAVESEEQLFNTAKAVKKSGAHALRGGAFKPRSSPESFSGLGEEGLRLLAAVHAETGLPIVSEVLDVRNVELTARYTNVLQIGARNMQNFPLLKEVGAMGKPVLLKRGFMATIEELLLSAEYVMGAGCKELILCERGIRTFENSTRNTLDISAVPVLKERTHLPVIIDPSHASGNARYISALSRAAAAVGADGLLVEVHHAPDEALSDGQQSLTLAEFSALIEELEPVVKAVGRTLDAIPSTYPHLVQTMGRVA